MNSNEDEIKVAGQNPNSILVKVKTFQKSF